MKKTDQERLKKISGDWRRLQHQMKARNIDRQALLTDEFLQWAVTTPLYNIGEQVYYLSDDIKDRYPELPWKAVAGLRHRLVHDYDGINWNIIVVVIFEEMDPFVAGIEEIIQQE